MRETTDEGTQIYVKAYNVFTLPTAGDLACKQALVIVAWAKLHQWMKWESASDANQWEREPAQMLLSSEHSSSEGVKILRTR